MRWLKLAAAAAAALSVLLCREARADRRPELLYLIATGPNSAVAERYLLSLCDLLRNEQPRRYRRVATYRTGDEIDKITKKLIADPTTSATPDLNAIDTFSQSLYKGAQDCLTTSNPQAQKQSDPDPSADILAAEWMQDGALRIQKGTRPGGTSRAQTTQIDKVQYVDVGKDPGAVARRIALTTLFPLQDTAQVSAVWVPDDSARCTEGTSDCVMISGNVKASISLKDSYWIRAKDLGAEIVQHCTSATDQTKSVAEPLELTKSETIDLRGEQLRVFTLEGTAAANCTLDVRVTFGSSSFIVALTPEVHIRKQAGIVGMPHFLSVFRYRLLAFWTADSMSLMRAIINTDDYRRILEANAIVPMYPKAVQPVDLSAWGQKTMAAIVAIPIDVGQVRAAALSKRLNEFVSARRERLAYDLLRGTIKSGPFCDEVARFVFGEKLIRSWMTRCADMLGTAQYNIWHSPSAAWIERYLVRPVDEDRTSAIPKLSKDASISWDVFPGPLNVPEDGREVYRINAVVPAEPSSDKSPAAEGQTMPFEVTVRGSAATSAAFDLHVGAVSGSVGFHDGRALAFGPMAAAQMTIFEAYSLDLAAMLMSRSDQSNHTERTGRFSLGGSLRIGNAFPQGDAVPAERRLIGDLGFGYMFKGSYAYIRPQLGWMFGPVGVVVGALIPLKDHPVDTVLGMASLDVQLH